MIRVENLCKKFGTQQVLDHVDLEVHSGEIFFILGASGSGKSVLLKHLIGLLTPDDGQVWVEGEEITHLPERNLLRIRKKVGYLFQEGALYDFMTVFDNIAFPLREHKKMPEAEVRRKVFDILKSLDLDGVEVKYPSELSGGMKKRVGLGRAIVLDSKILFCDEPTSGLDPIRSRDISDLIARITRQMGCTTVVTSHDMKNAFRIADRLALIHEGKIIALGTKAQWQQSSDEFVQEFIR